MKKSTAQCFKNGKQKFRQVLQFNKQSNKHLFYQFTAYYLSYFLTSA